MGFNALFVATGSMIALRFKPLKRAAVIAGRTLTLVAIAQFACFFLIDNVWVYEAMNLPMLLCLGMLFTVGNTLAMNEGRDCAGDASALIGLAGYLFGAVVSPLVGLGDIVHSTGIAIISLSAITLLFTHMSRDLPADLLPTPASAKRMAPPSPENK